MSRFFRCLILAALTLLLAACGTAPQPSSLPRAEGEPDPERQTTDVETAQTDDLTVQWFAPLVEIVGTGMGSQWGDEVDGAVLEVESDAAEFLLARFTVRFIADPAFPDTNVYTAPERVTFTAYDAAGVALESVVAAGAPPLDPTPDMAGDVVAAALIYQAFFEGEIGGTRVASVGVQVDEAPTDDDAPYENRALELYVLGDGDGGISHGFTPSEFIWWRIGEEVAEQAIDVPSEFEGGSAPVDFVVTDMDSDDRIVVLQVATGSGTVLAERTFTDPGYYPDGDPSSGGDFLDFWEDDAAAGLDGDFDTREELLLARLLVEVPAGTESLVTRVISPPPAEGTEGDSVIFSGVNAHFHLPNGDGGGNGGGEGCTPGFWRNWTGMGPQPNAWAATGYDPDQLFSTVFEDAFPGMTLHDVVSQGGGGLDALGRHTVAALLNAAHPDVSYDLSETEVISAFNAVFPGGDYEALKDEFEEFNEQGCPLSATDF